MKMLRKTKSKKYGFIIQVHTKRIKGFCRWCDRFYWTKKYTKGYVKGEAVSKLPICTTCGNAGQVCKLKAKLTKAAIKKAQKKVEAQILGEQRRYENSIARIEHAPNFAWKDVGTVMPSDLCAKEHNASGICVAPNGGYADQRKAYGLPTTKRKKANKEVA